MVLVMAILVMLVIIAVGYVTRTHAERVTAVSQQRAAARVGSARTIGKLIADEIALSLFPLPIDPFDPSIAATGVASSNWPRISPLASEGGWADR